MIGGAVHGGGGPALVAYLADAQPGTSRGLMSEGIAEQTRELCEEARASGHKSPLRHAWASPPPGTEWSEAEWDAYWTLYERAQGLEGCVYTEAIHDKPGMDGRPPHRHRVYLAITERGTLVRMGWDYAKQEAVSRITEHDTGMPMVKGKHNKHAARIARDLGREDVAMAMEAGGLLSGPPAIAAMTPAQRAQQERTGIMKADVARDVAAAWKASDGGPAFMAALQERRLWLAQGTKKDGVPVVLDGSGSTHGLRQMLGMAAREAGQPAPRQAAIAAFLGEAALPSLDEARAAQRAAGAEPAEPFADVAAPVPHDHEAAPALDGAAAPAAAGQSIPSLTEQAPAADATQPAPMDGQAAVPSQEPRPTLPIVGAGGGGGAPDAGGDGGGGGGAMGIECIDGPGEPPGPGASIQEVQRYREKRIAYEERRGQAWKRQQDSIAAENERNKKKGGTHAHVQAQTGIPGAPSALALFAAHGQGRPAESAQSWHGTREHSVAGRDTRDQGQGAGGRGFVGEPDGTAAGRGAEPDNGNPVRPGGRGRGPAQAGAADAGAGAHARQAIQAAAAQARLAAGLAAQPDAVAALRRARQELDPAWRGQRDAHAHIVADRRHIASVLATHPHPDPASRDALAREAAEERAARDEHTARVNTQAAIAEAAARAAFHGRGPLTWLRNVMLGHLTREQEHLVATAELSMGDVGTRPDDDTLRAARERGRLYAMAARERTSAWEALPEVAAAMEEARLNQAVDAAARGGDPAVSHALRVGDPEATRTVIREREAEERRQAEEMERRAAMQRGPVVPVASGAGGPGP